MAACSRPLAGLRRAARGTHICENGLLTNDTAMCCECCNSGTPLERPGMSHWSCEIWYISMHHSLQIMFILPLMTGHLFWKATILGGLYRGVPLYFEYRKNVI